jgi:hypothetical protein
MTTTTSTKLSKNGWPLGATSHPLGSCQCTVFETLKTYVFAKFKVTLTSQPFAATTVYCDISCEPIKLSMDRYGQIRAYIQGFNAGCNGY